MQGLGGLPGFVQRGAAIKESLEYSNIQMCATRQRPVQAALHFALYAHAARS